MVDRKIALSSRDILINPQSKHPSKRIHLDRHDWINAARSSLIEGGIFAVKVERVATMIGVTIGSFYWHFANRAELLNALLKDWKTSNSAAMVKAARAPGTASDRFNAFLNVWIEERSFSPAYDSAVRDWARSAPNVNDAVRRVDLKRIELLRGIYSELGYDDERAEVRARITYFHQVGFYALGLRDDEAMRLKLRPFYIEALRDGPGGGSQSDR